jgi:UDP-2,3-diacylglucosamine pyrophosphatase LpxH
MRRCYLVLSDLHLTDVEEHADGWKAYKRSDYLFDEELEALFDRRLPPVRADCQPILILNGDIFDFDLISAVPDPAPWPVSRAERKRGLEPTPAKSVWKLERMLAHHPRFVASLARHLGQGLRLVYVLGNHDREFCFREVQAAFVRALQESARAAGLTFAEEAVRFEPWFYYEPGEIYVEHGNQYDHYNSFRYLLSPTVQSGGQPTLALPMGNLSNRMLLSRMGFFNPHASDYILNVYRYLMHWIRHYAGSSRSIVLLWFVGSLIVMARLLGLQRLLRHEPPAHREELRALAVRFGLPAPTLEELAKLQRPPISGRLYRIMRELWIDRVLIALGMTAGTVALSLSSAPLWLKLMVPLCGLPLLYFIYEHFVQGETIFTFEHRLPECARAIATLLPVQVVTFGHTHNPRVIPLDDRMMFVDTGTWAPITQGAEGRALLPGLRNYLVADFTGDEAVIRLDCWRSSAVMPARSRIRRQLLRMEGARTAAPS